MTIFANRNWILLALATAAVVSYSIGFVVGLGLLIAAGLIFELAFWLGLIRARQQSLDLRSDGAP